jgi:hypothetical protein
VVGLYDEDLKVHYDVDTRMSIVDRMA